MGRGVAMQTTGWGLNNTKYHYCNKLGHYRNDCADFKAVQTTAAQAARRTPAAPAEARGTSSTREVGKCGAHTTGPTPTSMPIAAPGRQTSPTTMSTSPKSVLRVFPGSAARGILLCEMTSTRILAFHSRRERSSQQPSPPKPKWGK